MEKRSENFLDSSIQFLSGIGDKRAQSLQAIGINKIIDLLQYYPRRYLDRSHITPIRNLRVNETATVVARIENKGIKQGKRSRFVMILSDKTGYLTCVWFNQISYWQKRFEVGQTVAVSGKIGYFGGLQIVHPEFDMLSDEMDEHENEFVNTGKIIPLYSSTESLTRIGLDSRGFRRIMRNLFRKWSGDITDCLPDSVLSNHQLISLTAAIKNIHFPENQSLLKQAQRRIKFNEFFFMEFMLAYRKYFVIEKELGISFDVVGDKTKALVEKIPFELTDAQKQAIREIRTDMKKNHPMYRLIQGDVGSGKTMVAIFSMLICVENGYQAALMAPTEILAEQHFLTFHQLLEDLDVRVRLLVGAQKPSERDEILSAIESGACDIVIGTHALIQDNVKFDKLGLIVIDEQHRFGVLQRASLSAKGNSPDVLIMTATPIPRTLSLTLYGDLDISVINSLPAGRKPVKTSWRYSEKREQIYEFVKSKVLEGQQAYIVFPLIEESEKLDLQAATEGYEKMKDGVFSDLKIALLHGRMKNEEKDAVMTAFKKGDVQIIVSTTVIEVGVDVPNATIMVIENAERFGLTQLHQLRGRVGRGKEQSFCILIAERGIGDDALTRLKTMTDTNDGFKIAEVDLKLRGPGEFFGTRQHGLPELKIADPVKDALLLIETRDAAFKSIQNLDEVEFLKNQLLTHDMITDYRDKFELMRIG